MNINYPKVSPEEAVFLNEKQNLVIRDTLDSWECKLQGQDLLPSLQMATRKLTNDHRMTSRITLNMALT